MVSTCSTTSADIFVGHPPTRKYPLRSSTPTQNPLASKRTPSTRKTDPAPCPRLLKDTVEGLPFRKTKKNLSGLSSSHQTPNTVPVVVSQTRKSFRISAKGTSLSNVETMKPRPIQRKTQKRPSPTLKSPNPAQKRLNTGDNLNTRTEGSQQGRDSIGGSSGQRRQSDSTLRSGSTPAELETPHDSPVAPVSSRNGNIPRVMSAVRADNRQSSVSRAPQGTSLTQEALLRELKASEQRILKHIVSQQKMVITRFEKLETMAETLPTTVSNINSGIQDLKVMLLPSSKKSRSSSQKTSTASKTKSKFTELHKEMVTAHPTLPAELEIIFETNISCIAALKAIAYYVNKFHRNSQAPAIMSRAMNIFLFSCNRDLGKAVMKDGIGFRHGEFRFKVAKFMLQEAKTLPDRLFRMAEAATELGEEDVISPERKPSWLISNQVDGTSLALARKHHEWFVSELPKDPAAPELRKALYISRRFFKVVVDMFRQSRDKCKVRMFEDGTYCLLDWVGKKLVPGGLHNPKLTFLWPEEDVVSPSMISETAVGSNDEVSDANELLLQQLVSERKDMIVEARYHVILSKEPTAKARREDPNRETRIIRRVINILRIAKSFICGFCHVSEQDALRSDTSMLKCLYRVALVIRQFFQDKMYQEAQDNGVACHGQRRSRSGGAEHSEGDVQEESVGNHNRSSPTRGRDNAQRYAEPRVQSGSNQVETNGRNTAVPAARVREIPTLTLESIFPADSERDRIIDNHTCLSYEAYDRLHVALENEEEVQRDAPGNNERCEGQEHVYSSDSGSDQMSDMMDDDQDE